MARASTTHNPLSSSSSETGFVEIDLRGINTSNRPILNKKHKKYVVIDVPEPEVLVDRRKNIGLDPLKSAFAGMRKEDTAQSKKFYIGKLGFAERVKLARESSYAVLTSAFWILLTKQYEALRVLMPVVYGSGNKIKDATFFERFGPKFLWGSNIAIWVLGTFRYISPYVVSLIENKQGFKSTITAEKFETQFLTIVLKNLEREMEEDSNREKPQYTEDQRETLKKIIKSNEHLLTKFGKIGDFINHYNLHNMFSQFCEDGLVGLISSLCVNVPGGDYIGGTFGFIPEFIKGLHGNYKANDIMDFNVLGFEINEPASLREAHQRASERYTVDYTIMQILSFAGRAVPRGFFDTAGSYIPPIPLESFAPAGVDLATWKPVWGEGKGWIYIVLNAIKSGIYDGARSSVQQILWQAIPVWYSNFIKSKKTAGDVKALIREADPFVRSANYILETATTKNAQATLCVKELINTLKEGDAEPNQTFSEKDNYSILRAYFEENDIFKDCSPEEKIKILEKYLLHLNINEKTLLPLREEFDDMLGNFEAIQRQTIKTASDKESFIECAKQLNNTFEKIIALDSNVSTIYDITKFLGRPFIGNNVHRSEESAELNANISIISNMRDNFDSQQSVLRDDNESIHSRFEGTRQRKNRDTGFHHGNHPSNLDF
jgi:hypothetical protein